MSLDIDERLLALRVLRLLAEGDEALAIPVFWGSMVDESHVQGNLVFDAEIAAVCLEHGATTLLYEDRDFARFRSLQPISLEAFSGR